MSESQAPVASVEAQIAEYLGTAPAEPSDRSAPVAEPSGNAQVGSMPTWVEAMFDVTRTGLRPKQSYINKVVAAAASVNDAIRNKFNVSWTDFLVGKALENESYATSATGLSEAFALANDAFQEVSPNGLAIAFNLRQNVSDALANRAYEINRFIEARDRAHRSVAFAERNGRDAPDTGYVQQVQDSREAASLVAGMWVEVVRLTPIGSQPLRVEDINIEPAVRNRLWNQGRFLQRTMGTGAQVSGNDIPF